MLNNLCVNLPNMTLRKDQNPEGPKSGKRPAPQLSQHITTQVQEPRTVW